MPGKQILQDIVIGLEEVIDIRSQETRRFGTAGPLVNLFREVWKEEHHVFSAEGTSWGSGDATFQLGHPDRTPSDTLNRYPVEVLAIEETSSSREEKDRYWARWLDSCRSQNLPDYVIVAGAPSELVEAEGLQSKPWRRRYT
jgi:hypothetical protein